MKKNEINYQAIINLQIKDLLFPPKYELLPNSHEAWDWEMAFLEMKSLSETELKSRSAFFAKVNGDETAHYKMCNSIDTSIHNKKSIYTRAFFLANQFSTGYATHSLFPYRGKFHPQMVKGLLNITGVKPGELILDPMAGSFTACIEAKLLGIDSIGIDLSPFCVLMGKAKSFATGINDHSFKNLTDNIPQIFEIINDQTSNDVDLRELLSQHLSYSKEDEGIIDLIMLAFLDSVGYARRRVRKTPTDLFPEVFTRYYLTVKSFADYLSSNKPESTFGDLQASVGSILNLDLPDESIDCIITSPPYSFAIDYVDNDSPQLQILGINIDELKRNMIGLKGINRDERIQNYLEDMSTAFREMARVLKRHKYCVVVIGSNSIQTHGVKLDEEFKLLAENVGFQLIRDMIKPIKGIQNTLHEEHIMFFRDVK